MQSLERIVIHAGLHKTGSSFLQSSLELLEQKDAFADVAYPVLSSVEDFQFIRSGNGLELAKLLVNSLTDRCDETAIRSAFHDLVAKVRPDKRVMVISSEWFAEASPERFSLLRQVMREVCTNIQIVVFIRPFAPWAFSLYQQGVKRHGQSKPFAERVDQFSVKFDLYMNNLFSTEFEIKALPFTRKGLLPRLLEELSERKELADMVPDETVNRSLTAVETNLLRTSNAVFQDENLATLISDAWIRSAPSSEVMTLSDDQARELDMKLPEVIQRLEKYDNKAATEIGELLQRNYDLANSDNDRFYEQQEVHDAAEVILKVIKDHFSKMESRWSRMKKQVESIGGNTSGFDPIHYLLLNQDVLDAGVDPIFHYRDYGHNESRLTAIGDVSGKRFEEAEYGRQTFSPEQRKRVAVALETTPENIWWGGMKKIKVDEIVIHAGLHKTGTTSIQASLNSPKNEKILSSQDWLYPKEWPENHSIPVYSVFCSQPELYHINARQNLSGEQIRDINEAYVNYLKKEVSLKCPKKLIISGEDISKLGQDELLRFKRFLHSTFNPDVIKVIVYVRHPVLLATSRLQQKIKNGRHTLTSGLLEVDLSKRGHSIRQPITNLVSVFGQEMTEVYSFEEAVKESHGLVGHFLTVLSFNRNEIDRFQIMKRNESLSLLAAEIISFVNERIPFFVRNRSHGSKMCKVANHALRQNEDTRPIENIQGDKFEISWDKVEELKEKYNDEITWIRDHYAIDYSSMLRDRRPETECSISNGQLLRIKEVYGELRPPIQRVLLEYLKYCARKKREVDHLELQSVITDLEKCGKTKIKQRVKALAHRFRATANI